MTGDSIGESALPEHVAVIMDGNRRWARKRLLTRMAGQKAGAAALDRLIPRMAAAGYKALTVYAFSTENWKRPADEVTGLMDLLRDYIKKYIDDAPEDEKRLKIIGDAAALDSDLREKIAYLERVTADHAGMLVNIAINYGGRDEIRRAVKSVAADAAAWRLKPDDVDEDLIAKRLDTAGIPDPEIVIRTGGESRLSNFLLWQTAYSEIYVTDKLWPDFTFDDLTEAVRWYNDRNRRFGK